MDVKSDYYMQRKRCLCGMVVPTISEIRERWGPTFSDAFFETCPEVLKPMVGLEPPLQGAGDDLWTSPSDLLLGKVCLKPPLTSRYVKALTHQGILEIGHVIEQKYWNEMEIQKKHALKEQEEILGFLCEQDKKRTLAKCQVDLLEAFGLEKLEMEKEFADQLRAELKALEMEMLEEQKRILAEYGEQMDSLWQMKMDKAVHDAVENVAQKFLRDLKLQEELLSHQFELRLRKQQCKRQLQITQDQIRYNATFQQLKHSLECKNVANLMYMLCVERKKCEEERKATEQDFHMEIAELKVSMAAKTAEIARLEEANVEKQRQIDLREECLIEVMKQFQKFVNFALRAAPMQAEFLLCLEKLLLFELTTALAKRASLLKGATEPYDEFLPWKEDKTSTTPTSVSDLEAKDNHSCMDERTPPQSLTHSLASSDDLPAFHYNKHMYVREDFRNMLSRGIEISPSNQLWSRDVQHLMDILKGTTDGMDEKDNASILTIDRKTQQNDHRHSSVRFVQTMAEAEGYTPLFNNRSPDKMSVVLDSYPATDHCAKNKSTDSRLSSGPRRSTLKHKSLIDPTNVDYSKIGQEENRPMLLSARNSLEIMRRSTTTKSLNESPSFVGSVNTGILAVNDSLQKHRMSIKSTKLIEDEEDEQVAELLTLQELRKKSANIDNVDCESRLTLTRDSLIIHRQSLVAKEMEKNESKLTLAENSLTLISNVKLQKKEPDTISKSSIMKSLRSSFRKGSKSSILRQASRSSNKPSKSSLRMSRLTSACHDGESINRKSLKKDSLDQLHEYRASMQQQRFQLPNLPAKPSKISMHRNSLEIYPASIKSSLISTDAANRCALARRSSKESVEILDGGLLSAGARSSKRASSGDSVIKLEDYGAETNYKAVKLSLIEVVKIPDEETQSNVSFVTKPIVYETDHLEEKDMPWMIYGNEESSGSVKKVPRDNFLTKPNAATVVGDQDAIEHLQNTEEFTLCRAHSLLALMKNHPNLMKMFTSCTR